MNATGKPILLPIALPERPADRAFTLQYTTLILIIISFIVGSFGSHPRAKEGVKPGPQHPVEAAPEAPPPAPLILERAPSDTITIESLFKAASIELDANAAFAVASVLKSHDIDAEIDIVPDSMGDDDYRLALRQGRSLERYLAGAGVPRTAFRVFIVDSRVPAWAATDVSNRTTVRLYHAEEGFDGAR